MDNILEVKHVCKNYKNFSLNDFSFSIPKGAIVGFIGRNGAGKTTTLKGIMDLVKFDSGEITFMGKDMRENELEAKQNIGFALSELNFYPNKTIKDITSVTKRFYKNFDQDKFDRLCKLFNLDINKKLQELSSGMKVKYSLAIALSHDAKLLMLDEPTSGLDPISRDEVLDIFTNLVRNKEISILFSTHITSDLDKCADYILYINNGNKMFEGSKDEFINEYILIKGKIEDLTNEVIDASISYKTNGVQFTALIPSSNKSIINNYESIKMQEPDLEEIMVYLERGKNHEEFII